MVYANRFSGLLWFVYTCLQSEPNAITIYGAPKTNFKSNVFKTMELVIYNCWPKKPILMRKNLEYVSAKNECEMHFNTDLLT